MMSDPLPRMAGAATLADAARRLSGLAAVLCGWRPAEFWVATPDELAAVVAALTGGVDAADPPDAAVIAMLQEAFPDG